MTQTIIRVVENSAVLLEATKDWCVDMENPQYEYTMLDTQYGTDEVLIGRSKLCNEQIRSWVKNISRINTWIWSHEGIAYVRDLNSLLGTTVNSKTGSRLRILKGGSLDIRLRDGDQIILGHMDDAELRLEVEVLEIEREKYPEIPFSDLP